MKRAFPLIVAHRGMHHAHTENSLPAFEAAIDAGIPWLECDLWPSADDLPMIMHDETLDRTNSLRGRVADFSSAALRSAGVPSLTDLLAILPAHVGLLVEVKPEDHAFVTNVLRILRSTSAKWMLQSFSYSNYDFAVRDQRCETAALLVESEEELRRGIDEPRIHLNHQMIDPQLVDHVHRRGGEIGAWTVNKADDIRRMLELGIDMLITDEPELARQIIVEIR